MEKYKTALEQEKSEITGELQKIAVQSKTDPGKWESKFAPGDSDTGHEALETEADEVEEYGERLAVVKSLAERLADVDLALGKIAGGIYGKCENCNKDISLERLDANPAARVCFDCDGVPSKS